MLVVNLHINVCDAMGANIVIFLQIIKKNKWINIIHQTYN